MMTFLKTALKDFIRIIPLRTRLKIKIFWIKKKPIIKGFLRTIGRKTRNFFTEPSNNYFYNKPDNDIVGSAKNYPKE
jgi:hypothetical protein